MTTLDYDHLATEYARHRRPYPGLVEHVIERASLTAGSAVLEVGCGTANHLAAVQQATGARCLGIEPSQEMLRLAAAHPGEMEFRQERAEDFRIEGQPLDLVMSVDVIHYIREPLAYFRRAYTALKPGGWLVTVTDSDWVIRNRVPLARYFPATIEAEAGRYHPIPALAGDMALAGFGQLYERVIESSYLLQEASRFRDKSYSCLHLISEEDFTAGLAALEAQLAKGPIEANLRSVALWGRRPA